MNTGSWIGQALYGNLLALQAHLMVLHSLTALGYPRGTIHVGCHAVAYRPTSTGTTHFALALKVVCRVWQQVTAP